MRSDVYLGIAKYYRGKEGIATPEELYTTIKKQFPQSKIDEWLNQGQDFIVREARCLYGQATATVPVGTYWFYLPSICLDILSIYWKETDEDELRLSPRSQRQLDDEFLDWEVSTNDRHTDKPLYYVMFPQQLGTGAGHSIKLYPRNDVEGTIKIYFILKTTPMTTDASDVSIEAYWHRAVVLYAIYSAIGDAKDMQELLVLIQGMKRELQTKTTDAETFRKSDRDWRDKGTITHY